MKAEPKNIVICKKQKYLRYVLNGLENYLKHSDNRYFFNYFGNQYWKIITKSDFMKLEEKCIDLPVPNDNWSRL